MHFDIKKLREIGHFGCMKPAISSPMTFVVLSFYSKHLCYFVILLEMLCILGLSVSWHSICVSQECNLAVLEECILLGIHHTQVALQSHQNATHNLSPPPPPSPSRGRGLDPLLQAAQITLLRHINNIINLLPVPHRILVYGTDLAVQDEQYQERLVDDYFSETVFQLASALLSYLVTLDTFPWKPTVPDESVKDIGRFSILCLEVIIQNFEFSSINVGSPNTFLFHQEYDWHLK